MTGYRLLTSRRHTGTKNFHRLRLASGRRSAVLWMKSPRRRQYLGGVVFDPANRHGADYKNLWEGFACDRARDRGVGLRRHIWKVVCKRDKTSFKYFMRWMARAVQSPAEQGCVAVVMRGEEGCGKGIVARALLRLFGQHGRHITNAAHLVGRFNEHLQCCVMLFVDEAFFAGDVEHTGVLKAIITEPTLAIEAKYRSVIEAQNFLHLSWRAIRVGSFPHPLRRDGSLSSPRRLQREGAKPCLLQGQSRTSWTTAAMRRCCGTY